MTTFTLFFGFFFSAFSLAQDIELTITRGFILNDCSCKTKSFDQEPVRSTLKKGTDIGIGCGINDNLVSCNPRFPVTITCPKDCVELRKQGPLNREEWKKAIEVFVSKSAGAKYSKLVPAKVLKEIKNKYPNWIPAIYSRGAPFVANFELLKNFTFKIPLKISNKTQPVSVVYFFQDLDHMLVGEMNWSFWIAKNGELIYDSVAPYKALDNSYVHIPCQVTVGPKPKKIILYGIAQGVNDAAGCCGPYSLDSLKDKGPEKITEDNLFDREVIDRLCSNTIGVNKRSRKK